MFINDEEKMSDFIKITKEEFLDTYSYLTEKEYDDTFVEYEKNKEKEDGMIFKYYHRN